ncbi:MAG: PspC domain-containing protein [Chloroflexi bacterium]|nr:PspC domain-containing protein [Chloroflexota bacterium]MDA1147700.1 PspC domain-containing protein [Chloroflexota bacterium]
MPTKTRITRNLDDAMLGGVLSGVAARYAWDPTLLRIVAALATLATGVIPGVLLYVAAWLIVPRGERASAAVPPAASGSPVTEAGATPPAGDAPATASPAGATPVIDEITEALRDAADRLGEAASIAADAARRAANEIGEVARRPRNIVAADQPPPTGAAPATPPAEAAEPSEAPPASEESAPAPEVDQAPEPERFV